MRTRLNPGISGLVRSTARFVRSAFRRRVSRRALCCVLVINLFVWPGLHITLPDLSAIAAAAKAAATAPFDDAKLLLKRLFGPRPRPQETATDRLNHVAHITVNPIKHVLYQQQRMPFTSIATDYLGRTLQGIRFSYSSSDTTKLTVDEMGVATPLHPGLVWLTSTAGVISTRVPILILPGARPMQTDAQWAADQAKLNPDGTLAGSGGGMASLLPGLLDKLAPTAEAQSSYWGDLGDVGYDELWNDPRNLAGSPRNRITEQTNVGTVLPEGSNFELAIPMLSSPGRGVPLSLSLYYNSRIWTRHGNAVTFNAVNCWPFVGFTMGFGRILTYGSDPNTKFMLIDPDGTRHYLGSGVSTQTNTYQTNDGTHITYVGSATNGGTIYYTSGRSESVVNWGNRLLVGGISDTNGNSLSVSHAWQSAPNPTYCTGGNTGIVAPTVWRQAIQSIGDTRGCMYSFNYDACNNLTSITGPGQGGTSQNPVTITYAQFDYTPAYISNSFSGLTVENVPSLQVPLLNHIYFPVSQTGYTFSYSAYGMIYNVSKRRQMTIDQNGVISDGVESAHATFNYPITASSLTDAPSFSLRTESPGSANGFSFGLFGNNVLGANTITYREIPPDYQNNLASYPITFYTRSTDTTSPAYGLLTRVDVQNAYGTQFTATVYNYALDPGGSPQVQSVTTYDDTNTPIQVNYDYDQYGNVTNMREFGYQVSGAWQVRRRTHFTYLTDTNYLNAYLRNLMTEKDVYDAQLNTNDADDILIAKSTFQYDNYSAMGNMENYGGNYSGGSAPPGYNTAYNNQTLTVRGNQTGRTDYSDVVAGTSATFNNKRDIFGNMVQEQVTCCNLNTYPFTANTYWTLPDQEIKGDPNGIHLTKLITRDFNTQEKTAETDPNNLTTTFGYDNSGRPTGTALPTSATTSTSYNDAAMSKTSSVNYVESGGQKSVSLSEVHDGWDRVVQSVSINNGQVNVTYDPLGRKVTVTNPFTPGGPPGPAVTFQYDPLGRETVKTFPDNNTVTHAYSGGTTTVTDQVGRKIQQQTDGLGRLVTLVEEDSTGALTLSTSYTYDLLNDLTQVNQGNQIRSFKYDSLKRKIYERIPEQSATINDGTGTFWSTKYTYTTFNAVSSRQDARGVVITNGYDNINRLTSVSYNISGAPGVASTNNVTYTFDTSTTSATKGMLLSVTMNGSLPTYQENFYYDSDTRVSSRTWSRDGVSYTVGYQVNTANQLTQITYPSSRIVNLSYDGSARVASLSDPGGANYISGISYNPNGSQAAWVLGNGVREAIGYDANRLQPTLHTAGTPAPYTNMMNLTYSFQAAAGQTGANTTAGNPGQLVSISGTINGATENAAYSYNVLGSLATSSQTSNGASAQRRFVYDAWGNRTGVWDSTSGGNQIQTITLQGSGGVTTNGLATVSSAGESVYNTPGQCGTPTTVNVGRTGRYVRVQLMGTNYLHLAEVQVIGTSGQNLALGGTASQSSTVLGATASRANDGNTDGNFVDGSVSHTDFQNQPWWQVDLGSSQQVASVKVWNRTDCCPDRATNFNVIVSDQPITTVGFMYDAAGNMTFDGVHTYQYDAENRLVQVDGGSTASCAYDYQNQRIKKSSGAASTHYIWDAGRVLAEHNAANGAQLIDYIYALGRVIAEGPGNSFGGNGSLTFIVGDRMSARISMDRYGNVLGVQSHLPFGEDLGESGSQEKHHFTTYERDNESGNDYAKNRYYSFVLGRFLSSDPFEQQSGCGGSSDSRSWNRYSYTRNVAINRVDPEGLSDQGPIYGDCPAPSFLSPGGIAGRCLCTMFPEFCDRPIFLHNVDGNGDGHGGGGAVANISTNCYKFNKKVLHDCVYDVIAPCNSTCHADGVKWAESDLPEPWKTQNSCPRYVMDFRVWTKDKDGKPKCPEVGMRATAFDTPACDRCFDTFR